MGTICTVILVAIVLGASFVGVVHWSRRRDFSSRMFLVVFGVLFLISAVNAVNNNWPNQAAQASTAQPLAVTAAEFISVSLVFAVFTAAALALAAGLLAAKRNSLPPDKLRSHILAGVGIGFVFAGIGAVARHAVPPTSPSWGNMSAASAYIPWITMALSPLTAFFIQSIILLTVIHVLVRRPRFAAFLIVVGLAVAGSGSIETIPSWLVGGLTTGAVLMLAYFVAFRHQPSLVILAVAAAAVLSILRDGIQRPYPTALVGAILGAVLVAFAAWVWFKSRLEGEGPKISANLETLTRCATRTGLSQRERHATFNPCASRKSSFPSRANPPMRESHAYLCG